MRAVNNPSSEFVYTWSEELSEQLSKLSESFHRTPIELRTRGLSAPHFPNQALEIYFQDGSLMRFNYALFVVSKDGKCVAVFTEHCGYFSWTANLIESVKIEEEQVFPTAN